MENLKITKGKCNIEYPLAGDFILHVDYVRIISVHLIEDKLEEQEANAELIADAFNTANKCNLLPSELLEQRDELLKCLKLFLDNGYQTPSNKDMNEAIKTYKNIEK